MTILFLYSHSQITSHNSHSQITSHILFERACKTKMIKTDKGDFADVWVKITNNHQTQIFHKNTDLQEYDVVYFRSIKTNYEMVFLISHYLDKSKSLIVDREYRAENFRYFDGKAAQMFVLTKNGLPVINTFFIGKSMLKNLDFPFPLIAKTSLGARGEEVQLCQTKKELLNCYDQFNCQHLVIQPFIKNDGDIRAVVLGNEVVASIKRVAAKGQYKNNVSLGGSAFPINLSAKEQQLAINATKAVGIDIAGVDLIKNGTKYVVMEVNRSPQIVGASRTTKLNIASRILDHIIAQVKK